jgi:hypothetical protein
MPNDDTAGGVHNEGVGVEVLRAGREWLSIETVLLPRTFNCRSNPSITGHFLKKNRCVSQSQSEDPNPAIGTDAPCIVRLQNL